MAFLNPFFLIGSLALAVPVLIHLVRREKSEVIPFSSLMFLLKVPKRSIRQQKLKNLLLMALRLLLLAFLVGAFARPYFTQDAPAAATGGEAAGIVMMLDNSYSMRYGTTFDRMKNEAIQRIDAMEDGGAMALIAFNNGATILSMPTSDKNQLRAAVSALEPSSGGTRYYEAFNAAARLLGAMEGREKQLIMISDFQRVGWNRSSREGLIGVEVKMEAVDLGVEQPENVGIDSVQVEPTTFTRTYSGRVVARIRNYRRDQPVNVPVSLSIDGREVLRREVNVPLNSAAVTEFTGFDLLGFSKGVVKIESGDPLPMDDEFIFALERRDKLKVLILDDGRPQQSFYLQQAYTASSNLPFEVRILQAQRATGADLDDADVLVVNDVRRLPDGLVGRMDEVRKSGQGQIVILGENADVNWWAGVESLPAKPVRKIYVEKDRRKPYFAWTSFDRNHKIFAEFERSPVMALNSAQFFAFTELQPKPDASVLAKFEDGSPVLVESRAEDRGLLVFANAVDNPLRWNDLTLKPAFVPLFQDLARYLSGYAEVRGWYALGDGVPVAAGLEEATAAVVTPGGERQSLGDLAPGEQRVFTPLEPGFHNVQVGRDLRVVAVNPPLNEGNLGPMPSEDLLAGVQRTEGETQRAGILGDTGEEDSARRQMFWWYLLIVALLAGIAEIYIANRSQRSQAEVRPIKGML